MAIMGWSSAEMAARYQHVLDSIRKGVADQVGELLWDSSADPSSALEESAAQEALLTAVHVADSHLVQVQDAYVTATLLQNVGPVLQALQPTKDAVVRAGALLIVKIDWSVQVYQLTAAQQAILDHRPHLAASPGEIITALESPEPDSQEAGFQSSAPQLGTGTIAAATAN
jgi:hypothetical protein